MRKLDVSILLGLSIIYGMILFHFYPNVLTYRFQPDLVQRYYHSQDIPHEVKDRIFLSDSDIYLATGYLYAKGASPTTFNFQHPPLMKYLFGWSILWFNNPFVPQVILGLMYIWLTYVLGKKLFAQPIIAGLACLMLIIDPVFLNTSTTAFLDLGQAVFTLLYIMSVIFWPKNAFVQGIILGLFAATKFWSPVFFFIVGVWGLKFLQKKSLDIKTLGFSVVIAGMTFSLTYLKTFVGDGFRFNILFWQLKMLKYMVTHNGTHSVGGPLVLYLTGYFVQWWDNLALTRAAEWTLLWPLSFINAVGSIFTSKSFTQWIIFVLPVGYLLSMWAQLPFTRYFAIVLPYFYLGLAYTAYTKVTGKKCILYRI